MKSALLSSLLILSAAATAGAQQQPVQQGDQQPAEIPAEYLPPKGMCRIWLKDVPPAQQPAAKDCPSAVKNVPRNGRVIFGETAEVKKGKGETKEVAGRAKALTGKGRIPPIIRKPPL